LGGFQAILDDDAPVNDFHTRKARALLAYLAVETNRPHERAYLAGLLWPTWSDAKARAYLRQTVANLHDVLHDRAASLPFLLISHQTIQLNSKSDHWTDVMALTESLASLPFDPKATLTPDAVSRLQQAVDLYRGRFLEGFFLKGCSEFEEWQLLTGESIERQVATAFSFLARWHETRGECNQALRSAWRHAELEPLSDAANRRIMRLLALEGDPGAALAHYEHYRHLLARELEATPAPETVDLAAQIRRGRFLHRIWGSAQASQARLPLPPFLPAVNRPRPSDPFVARERELAQLHDYLNEAISGQGRVAFVVGDAGQGKSFLLQEFIRQALASHNDLLAVGGRCSNYQGVGDPYQPFREILAQLSGDFVAQWEAGAVGRDLARRLWAIAPFTVEALLAQGPDLLGALIPLTALQERMTAMPGGGALAARLGREARSCDDGPSTAPRPCAIFDQCTRVLHAVARAQPLILWLDDLHWGDPGSLSLFLHLGQRLSGHRLLVVGVYRPEEAALSRDGRHPLERLILEFQQRDGQITVDLNRADGRAFVEAYVDSDPNRLGRAFRDTLFMVSNGHPLFAVELLKNMQAGGGLVQDEAGRWVQGQTLEWHALPPRVEAVIAQRIERLPSALRSLLDVAAVQGVEFTAEVLATVLGLDIRDVVHMLGSELDRRHNVITPLGLQRLDQQRLAHYRFRHPLVRDYLLERLDDIERLRLNEAVVIALDALSAAFPDELFNIAE
jgi:DNA-binding SARP family transcriptional activator